MKCVIVVEGTFDDFLVSAFLKSEAKLRGKYKIAVGGNSSSAMSLARSYLATTDVAVAFLLDADFIEDDRIAEERSSTAELLAAVSSPSRFSVVLSIPTIETILFSDRRLAESIFKRKFSALDWNKAKTSPRRFLREILEIPSDQNPSAKVARLLKGKDLRAGLQCPPLSEIREFIMETARGRHSMAREVVS